MTNIIETIHRLPDMEHAVPAGQDEILRAEHALGLRFAEEYRQYLSAFGAAWSDIIVISGILDAEDYHVVSLTQRMRSVNPDSPSTFYAIEDVGVDGLVIWQDHTGTVYQSIPNHPPVKIFDSLSAFLDYQMED